MTDLFCKTNHIWGKAVLVNGHNYEIDEEGVATIDNEVDVEKLLTMSSWCRSDDPESLRAPREHVPESQRGALLADGTLVPTQTGQISDEENADLAGRNPETGEYPDPDVKMQKAQLQALARVYNLEFDPKDTKSQLVELIHEAMYE